ncbi:MAG: D-alanyl-D-alanine endopeptidase [Candidatus Magasanikbacteria bacterium]|nr:D-alanyl-D-alanine endopeptidase [Candidatus Magasanikbacteria bacterium]
MRHLIVLFFFALFITAAAPSSAFARVKKIVKPPACVPTIAQNANYVGEKIPVCLQSFLIADQNGMVIDAKNASAVRSIASLTKMMTAVVLLNEWVDWDTPITFNKKKHLAYKNDMEWRTGEKIAPKDLFYTMLTGSINEAANMLVDATPYTRPEFVKKMNEKAQELGLANTHFADPSGLNPKNVSTAEDILKLFRHALTYPEIELALSAPSYEFDEIKSLDKRVHRFMHHTNPLMRQNQPFEIVASKTGFINEAQRTMAMQFIDPVKAERYFVIALGEPRGRDDYFGTRDLVVRFLERTEKIAAASQ